MKSLLKIVLLGLVLFVLLPSLAMAQPNKKNTTTCGGCHNGAIDPGQTVSTAVNGVEGTSFSVAPGSTIEVDFVFRGMRGYTPTRGVVGVLGLPAGWTPALTTNTSNPASVGGTPWNTFWDNPFTQGTPSATPQWEPCGAEAGTVPTGLTSTNVYRTLFVGSSWENGSGSAFDDGSAGDLDGVTDVMGADVRLTVPATGGPWTIYVGGIGHGTSAKAMTTEAITISLSGGDSTAPVANNDVAVTPESGTFVPAAFTVTGTFTDAESAVSSCEYTLDGSAWSAGVVSGAGPYTCTANVTGQTDTTALTINMRATSGGGGPTASTAINRTVDAAAPTTTDNVPAGWQTADVTVTLTPADAGSGVASTSYCVDQANACVPGTAYGAPFLVSTEGNNFVRYSSTDNLGNIQTVVSKTLDIDKTKPTDGVLTATAGNNQVGLAWTAATDGQSGLTSPAYKLVRATGVTPPADCTPAGIYSGDTPNYTDLTAANGTTYSYRVCAYDVAGQFSVGTTDSATPVAGNSPANVPANPAQYQSNGMTVISVGGFATATTVIFEGDLTDPDADTVKLQIDYTGDLNFDCETALVASGTANVQVSCPGLTDGNSYDWSYRAVDSNAAASAWTAFNGASPDFSVDATAPSVSLTAPFDTESGVAINSQVTITFDEDVCATVNTTNVTSDSPTWTLNNCTAGVAVFDTGGQSASTPYNVSVTAAVTDLAGNTLSAAPVNFSYTTGAAVNNAPTVLGSLAQYEADGSTPIAGGGNSATNSVVIEAQINDADGDLLILEVDIDSNGTPDCVSPAVTATGTPQALCSALVDAAYDWQVRAKDDQGATSGWSPLGGSPDFNIVAGVDVGVDTTAPAESGLNATPGDSIIDLVWNPADDGSGSGLDPVNTYKVARSTVANPVDCNTGTIYTGNINAYSDTTVVNATTYYYRVCAYDVLGNGSVGQTTSGTPGSSCTVGKPTVSILTASKEITSDGGFVDYSIQVTNTDTGACVAPNLDLVLNDSNGTNFYGSLFGADPLNVAAGASVQTTIRVRAIAGQPNTSFNDTYFYTAFDGTHLQSDNSNTVTTTINVTAGGCVAGGDYLNSNGDQFLTERR